ncbi:MAG TPA: patatin-like phospholipase family protein [Clostridiaceae bacterium]|nr:patatin-like phospholipase family protein [Clostridiaceae bacterium]
MDGIGLVLEGGGARGSYQIGACKALKEMGIEFSGVAGTSVGALNGAMIVQDNLEEAYDFWSIISPDKIINFTDEEVQELGHGGIRFAGFSYKINRFKKIIAERGIDIRPLIDLLKSVINEEKIRKSRLDFGIVAFDITSVKPVEVYKEDIPEGKLVDYLIASSTFPGFKPKEIDGRLYADGGIYNVLPINLMSNKGYKNIIAVRTFGIGRRKKFDEKELNITYIAPAENLGPILDFSNERAKINLQLGYYDAIRVFKGLKGKRYYIKPYNDEDFFLEYLMGLSKEKIAKLCKLFGIEKSSSKRVLFEYIIPKIASLLGASENASYEDISIALIEKIADISGVERFKIYDLADLISEITRRYVPVKTDFLNEIPGFLMSIDIVTKINRDKILGSIANELFMDLAGAG